MNLRRLYSEIERKSDDPLDLDLGEDPRDQPVRWDLQWLSALAGSLSSKKG